VSPRVLRPVDAVSDVRVEPVSIGRRDLDRFCAVQREISGSEPQCVLPLEIEVKRVLSDSNPYWQRAERQLWVAEKGGSRVGRVAGIFDEAHAVQHGERCAFFGFLETVNDPEVTAALLGAVEEWARKRGAVRLRGPMNPNINEECGLLVEGFDRPNAIMMPYNPPWFGPCVEAAGYVKAKDLLAYDLELADSPRPRLIQLRDGLKRRFRDLTLRAVTPANLGSELPALKSIYNAAWERNWSALPMTAGEIDFLADRLKPLLMEGLVWMAMVKGAPVGLLLAVPDVNEVLGPMRGRLLTPAVFGALPVLLGWRRPRRMRLIALGVTEGFRGRGLEGWMFAETLLAAEKLGFKGCEASWVLEDNFRVQRLTDLFRARVTRRYRIYDRRLDVAGAAVDPPVDREDGIRSGIGAV